MYVQHFPSSLSGQLGQLSVGELVEGARELEISLQLAAAEIALAALWEEMEAYRNLSPLVEEDRPEASRRTLAAPGNPLLDQMASEIGVDQTLLSPADRRLEI